MNIEITITTKTLPDGRFMGIVNIKRDGKLDRSYSPHIPFKNEDAAYESAKALAKRYWPDLVE